LAELLFLPFVAIFSSPCSYCCCPILLSYHYHLIAALPLLRSHCCSPITTLSLSMWLSHHHTLTFIVALPSPHSHCCSLVVALSLLLPCSHQCSLVTKFLPCSCCCPCASHYRAFSNA